MKPAQSLDKLASTQHAAISRPQLRSIGLTDSDVTRLVGAGWLEQIVPGVFRIAGSPPTFEQRLMAACLVNGRQSVVTHRAACELWELDIGLEPVVELSVPRGSSARTPGAVIHRPWKIDHRHVTQIGSFMVTTPARTVADLGAVVDKPVVTRAVELVLRRRLASTAYLRHLCDELENPRRKGPPVLRQSLAERLVGDTPSDSDIELVFAEICNRHELPLPVFQFEILIDGERKRIDFAFDDLKLAIEIDGWEEHMRYSKFQSDRVRRNELELMGWTVLNFTWAQVMHDPGYVADVLRRALQTVGA